MNIASGATRAVMEGSLKALAEGEPATLAIVVETLGSTYVRQGAVALFGPNAKRVGWLSGGCLEPEIARRAEHAATSRCVQWMEIDTRDEEDLFAGSAVGCRGRLRLILLPILAMSGWRPLARAWLGGSGVLELSLDTHGQIDCRLGGESTSWDLPSASTGWEVEGEKSSHWCIQLPAPPSVLILGAGPETPLLVPLLRSLGWMTSMVESRPRWLANSLLADHRIEARPEAAIAAVEINTFLAVVIMQHNFEMDLEALQALALSQVPFIGLLGPRRRRDDLFSLLSDPVRESLSPRLHSPVGLDLGGHGPEAIALSIAAQLQALQHHD